MKVNPRLLLFLLMFSVIACKNEDEYGADTTVIASVLSSTERFSPYSLVGRVIVETISLK